MPRIWMMMVMQTGAGKVTSIKVSDLISIERSKPKNKVMHIDLVLLCVREWAEKH
jgi:hypothetical protein